MTYHQIIFKTKSYKFLDCGLSIFSTQKELEKTWKEDMQWTSMDIGESSAKVCMQLAQKHWDEAGRELRYCDDIIANLEKRYRELVEQHPEAVLSYGNVMSKYDTLKHVHGIDTVESELDEEETKTLLAWQHAVAYITSTSDYWLLRVEIRQYIELVQACNK
jgi:hypothetical protein